MDKQGILYVVATPIGNLDDTSKRAIDVLNKVDCIAAEDTRHSRKLLQAFSINTPLRTYHDFSSTGTVSRLLTALAGGQSLALISDAGTPLISDPGFKLVAAAREAGIQVLPVPGPSALMAALCIAGIPTDRFAFEGFLPEKAGAREKQLRALATEKRTLVFYEAPHRIERCLQDLDTAFGSDRPLFIGRELTKKFEAHHVGSIASGLEWLGQDSNNQRGEFVLVLGGNHSADAAASNLQSALDMVAELRTDLSLKRAVELAARFTGVRKNALYEAALEADDK